MPPQSVGAKVPDGPCPLCATTFLIRRRRGVAAPPSHGQSGMRARLRLGRADRCCGDPGTDAFSTALTLDISKVTRPDPGRPR
jgi:hypothetical protein